VPEVFGRMNLLKILKVHRFLWFRATVAQHTTRTAGCLLLYLLIPGSSPTATEKTDGKYVASNVTISPTEG